jgi:hypothetical protein
MVPAWRSVRPAPRGLLAREGRAGGFTRYPRGGGCSRWGARTGESVRGTSPVGSRRSFVRRLAHGSRTNDRQVVGPHAPYADPSNTGVRGAPGGASMQPVTSDRTITPTRSRGPSR